MAKNRKRGSEDGGFKGVGGLFGGLGTLLEKLGELAQKGEELRESGEIQDPEGKVRGIYGFNIKVGLGDQGVKVEPFGNLRKDKQTGRPIVAEEREPMVDVFDEDQHVLVVAEMPGVGEDDVTLELTDDILTIAAGKGQQKYRKEVQLPAAFPAEKMSHTCRNGILQVRLDKSVK